MFIAFFPARRGTYTLLIFHGKFDIELLFLEIFDNLLEPYDKHHKEEGIGLKIK